MMCVLKSFCNVWPLEVMFTIGTLSCRTATRRRRQSKICSNKNSIKSLSFVMNGINLIELEKKKCMALSSKQLLVLVLAHLLSLPFSQLVCRRCRQDVNIYVLTL